ncbi:MULTISPECIES: lipocalin family protein [Pseudomonas]|uniref:Outer membrane lipoprotein Blc n=1 Tax=Pseudomonas donghuensis TaxID=1163398 RepID=A0AAP0X9V5_9PSED|nr:MULTISPECIES: lipocalin family protein [Pseudomonas]MDF9891274.1 apolipoprotein D and lipocalin family protein [Pseudomonas vranovensis]KDN99418.1 lipocalin family protein [Pseudomonas donghuensis]MBF4206310.1 lipocalin [Pseudomonas donghuensis]MBS7598962.1 lipocalin family protein [Pseudomonas sp. RC2C2]MCP6693180.1 lipocalin family protein [Pseudomonas donghuensis]
MKQLHLLLALCAGLILGGCASSGAGSLEPKTANSVDLKRYQGKWYELARLPMYFQRDCAQSEAHYNLKPDGSVGVLNRCRTLEGEWQEASGTANVQVPGKTDKLWVVFDNWFSKLLPGVAKGDYWILYVDDKYHTALVGNPDRKYLWILSRTPTIPALQRESLLAKARQQGYDTQRLIWRVADKDMAAAKP